MADPVTERGRYLLTALIVPSRADILAIEAEASEGLRAALERLPRATCYRTHLSTDEHLGVSGAVWIADAIRALEFAHTLPEEGTP